MRRHGIVSRDNIGLNVWGGDSSTSGQGHILATPVYSKVSHGGKWYAVIAGQEAWASANPPSGTTAPNQGWVFMSGPGTVVAEFPAWSAGINLRAAYPIWVSGGSSFNSIVGFYSEGDQPPSLVSGNTLWQSPMAPAILPDGQFHGGMMTFGTGGLEVPRGLRVGSAGETWGVTPGSCALFVDGDAYLTRDPAVVHDPTFHINTTNAYGTLQFERQGNARAQIQYYDGNNSFYYIAMGAGSHYFHSNGEQVAEVGSDGIDLKSGNALKVAGSQVVGARGAAVADATDAASAVTQLNALLARCRAHGLIAS